MISLWICAVSNHNRIGFLPLLIIGLVVIGFGRASPPGPLLQGSSFQMRRFHPKPLQHSSAGEKKMSNRVVPLDVDLRVNEINLDSQITERTSQAEPQTKEILPNGVLSEGSFIDNGFVLRHPLIAPEIGDSDSSVNLPRFRIRPMEIHNLGAMGPLSILEEFNNGFIN